MKYKELKKFDLDTIHSNEEGEDFVNKILSSDEIDKLKYINFLLWQKYNTASMNYMLKINTILTVDELLELKKEHNIKGRVEDLEIVEDDVDFSEVMSIVDNNIIIDDEVFLIKSVLEDDFEEVVIVEKNKDLYKFGLNVSDIGEFFAYELFEEESSYYQSIIDAKIGTKINVVSAYCGVEQSTKTFRKIGNSKLNSKIFKLTKKTSQGILSPVLSGTYTIIKSEDVLSNNSVSEDKILNEVSKVKHDIAKKLNIDMSKFEEEIKDVEESEDFPKSHFTEDYKFTKDYCFSIETPEDSFYNPLTQTILLFNGNEYEKIENGWLVSDEYVDEVYQFLFKKFDIAEEMEGYWVIENTKLESILRCIIRAGGKMKANDDNASSFLQMFLREDKLKRILKTSKTFKIVKRLITKKEVEEFAKDTGTEMYIDLGQILTSVLEGAQRLYGEGYVVFDSDYKITICQVNNLDLVSASEYAIDNDYKDFYVINKDDYKGYDAWYKETVKMQESLKESEQELKDIEKVGLSKVKELEEKLKKYERVDEHVLYESEEPVDIVVCGTEYDDSHDFSIDDDYSGFNMTKKGENLTTRGVDCDGFISIVDAKDFFKNAETKIEGFDNNDFVGSVEFYLIRGFVGRMKLRVSINNNYINTTELVDDYIWHQLDNIYGREWRNNNTDRIEIDIQQGEVVEIDSELYNEMKKEND